MSYIKDSLSTDEAIEEIFKLHWFCKAPILFWFVITLLALGLAASLTWGIDWLALFNIDLPLTWAADWRLPFYQSTILADITLLKTIYEWLKWRSIEQGVTNRRVVYKRGIISRQSDEMKLSSIETVEINQTIGGRLFGYGNVEITGRGVSKLVFNKIDSPIHVKRTIDSVNAAYDSQDVDA